jgi:hypothetical protein
MPTLIGSTTWVKLAALGEMLSSHLGHFYNHGRRSV